MKIIIACLLSVFTTAIYGQTSIDSEKQQLIAAILAPEIKAIEGVWKKMGGQLTQQLVLSLKNRDKTISQTKISQLNAIVDEVLTEETGSFFHRLLTTELYPLYDRRFTTQELRTILAFNRSAVGEKMQALLYSDSMAVFQRASYQQGIHIAKTIQKRITEAAILTTDEASLP